MAMPWLLQTDVVTPLTPHPMQLRESAGEENVRSRGRRVRPDAVWYMACSQLSVCVTRVCLWVVLGLMQIAHSHPSPK